MPLPPCPLLPTISLHWLAVKGVQPAISENPSFAENETETQHLQLPKELQVRRYFFNLCSFFLIYFPFFSVFILQNHWHYFEYRQPQVFRYPLQCSENRQFHAGTNSISQSFLLSASESELETTFSLTSDYQVRKAPDSCFFLIKSLFCIEQSLLYSKILE
jgi:hypothetical protein